MDTNSGAGNQDLSVRLKSCARKYAPLLLLLAAFGAQAGSVFKCVDADGAVAFQSTACATTARQAVLDVHEQPLIDPHAFNEVPATTFSGAHHNTSHFHAASVAHSTSARSRDAKRTVSWECRAGDGEVFYRHMRCPHSVRGDGTVRDGESDAPTATARGKRRRARDAWGSLPVSARKVSRVDACRQIKATTAIDRDGYARDEQVSVYDHDVGRDPCKGY